VAVIRDLTDRRALEEIVQRKEKLSAMGELASGVAHEVRNPLNAIGMIAQRLNKEFKPQKDEQEYKTLAGTVVSEVGRINTMIQRFLKFAKPQKLILETVEIDALVREIIDLVEVEAENAGISITQKRSHSEPLILDKNQIKQVLLNILQNSLQASGPGQNITLSSYSDQTDAIIEIKDNGTGIPKQHLHKIFDLYYTTKKSGTGMGLSIANQIVAAHGGRIEVESEEGNGTLFRIILPKNNRG
jgi:signal transduction histidine kinase